jgi:CheY-like chemotaxis protein/HPt (histidine-containing phosphotransfer) domain-containing protein
MAASQTSPSPLSREQARQQNCLILLAEDNAINQKVVLHQLALLGYAAEAADNGRTALARWQSGDYALLLTDLFMPEMGGYQLAAEIRSLEPIGSHAPIIALTGNPDDDEVQRCRAAGMDDCLSKPLELADLQEMLSKWLPLPSTTTRPPAEAIVHTEPPAGPVLETERLAALVGDNPAVIRQFLHEYRNRSILALGEMRAAHAGDDLPALGAVAHKLKSSSLAVGAVALGRLCAQLEQASHAGHASSATALLSSIETEMAEVEQHLDILLAEPPAGRHER